MTSSNTKNEKRGSKIFRILFFSLAVLLAYAPASFAQTVSVSGTVTDSSGDPLVGVYVTVQGQTTNVAISAANGRYTINAPAQGTLVFSYLGMETLNEPVGGRIRIDAIMSQSASTVEEVVVIGYGSVKRQHLTGSVAVATDTEIKKSTVSNLSQTLVGKLPGITTQQAGGAPGADGVSILIRGYSSYNGSAPLILVDGVERPMGNINPNDVASVNVLKDAGATAVYGIKAANGVVLITTKRGSAGKAQINYRGSVTLSQATAMPRMMNGTQYMEYYNLASAMDWNVTPHNEGDVFVPMYKPEDIAATYNGDLSDGIENTNWMSQMERTTIMHQHSLSASGGGENVRYFISGNYLDQNGIIKGYKNQVGNFRSNVDATPMENLKVSLNVAANHKDFYRPGAHSWNNWQSYNVFHTMMYSLPYVPKYFDGQPTSGYRDAANAVNPEYGMLNSGFSQSRTLELETSANVEYSAPFLKGLKAGMFVAWDHTSANGKSFFHEYYVNAFNRNTAFADDRSVGGTPRPVEDYGNASKGYIYPQKAQNTPQVNTANGTGGSLYTDGRTNQNVLLRPSLSYNNKFGKHDVGALFLYEQTQNRSTAENSSILGFPLYDIAELNKGDVSTAKTSGSSGRAAYAGYVGRLNYAYDDKYLAEASFRYDGSYLFPKAHRWGFFPSVSLGWVMSRENFFREKFPEVEYFKLRGSVGLSGAANVTQDLFRKIYNFNSNYVAFGNSPKSQSTLMNGVSYPMEDLTWEKTRTTNVGFELSAWNGLFGMEFDFFYKYTYDILVNLANSNIYPPSLGGHTPTRMNDGAFDARGFELSLKHRNNTGVFNYGITANLSYATNRILRQQQPDNVLPWRSVIGTSVGDIWGLKTDGLFQSEEELMKAPAAPSGTPHVGDIKYVDINGDGRINGDDYVKIANGRMPKMMYSLMLDGEWKGLDFSIQFQGGAISDLMIQYMWSAAGTSGTPVADQTPLTRPFYANYDNSPLYLLEGSWTEENRNAEFPRLSLGASGAYNASPSDWWKRNGAYLRLKNVAIGYTLPDQWMSRINIEALRVYVSGNNLLTASEFKWVDPESVNVPTGIYPQQRTFSFGIDLTF